MTEQRTLDQTPRDALKDLIDRYGPGLMEQPGRVGGLLRDICGQYRLEISLIVVAAEEGIPSDLRLGSEGTFAEARMAQLSTRLESTRGLSPENARWAVQTWASVISLPSHPALQTHSDPPRAGETPPAEIEAGESHSHSDRRFERVPPVQASEAVASKLVEKRGKKRRAIVGAVMGLVLVGGAAFALPRLGDPGLEGSPSVSPSANVNTDNTDPEPPDDPVDEPTPPPPKVQQPRNLHLMTKSYAAVRIRWKKPAGDVRSTKYLVMRNGQRIGSTKKLTFYDSEVAPSSDYRYWVVAVADGSRARSKVLAVTTDDPPPPPPPPPDPLTPYEQCIAIGGIWLGEECLPP